MQVTSNLPLMILKTTEIYKKTMNLLIFGEIAKKNITGGDGFSLDMLI